MSQQIKTRFGVWMDTHQATIVGYNSAAAEFSVVGHAKNPGRVSNSNENAAHNTEITLTQKYFKEIGTHLVNADEIHITGTGTIQEQFMHYLEKTPQFKGTVVTESTSKPMSDERLVEFVTDFFN